MKNVVPEYYTDITSMLHLPNQYPQFIKYNESQNRIIYSRVLHKMINIRLA